jgi:hypothetical protein
MAWLERLNDHNSRRLSRDLRRNAYEAGQLAQDHLQDFAREAAAIANRTVQQVGDYGRHEGADLVRDRARHYADVAQDRAHEWGDQGRRYAHIAGDVAGQLASYGRREAEILADAATAQALRVGRAVKADPVPVIVGAIGLALVANLLRGRRR